MFRFSWWVLTFMVFTFISFQLIQLYRGLPDISRKSATSLAATLFNDLNAQGLLSINKEDWRISLPEKDRALLLKLKNGEQANDAEIQTLLDRLYYQPYGDRLQQQVKQWNYSRRLAAIRDNRPQTEADKHNQWNVNDNTQLVLDDFSTVPFYFGYITQGKLISGFHNWRGASLADQPVIFSSDFDLPNAQKITLQVIGQPDLSSLNYKHTVTAIAAPTTIKGKQKADSYEIVVQLPQGKSQLRLAVAAVVNPNQEMQGVALMVVDKQRQKNLQAMQQNQCKPPENKPEPDDKPTSINSNDKVLVWNNCSLATRTAKSSAEFAPFTITTRDDQLLTHAYAKDAGKTDLAAIGKPTELTQNTGLTALIGQDKHDLYSLSGLMWHANKKQNAVLKLTLDSRLQQITQDKLEQGIKKRPSPYRRAAVVMLNAETGEILAAANYPNPKQGVHPWDRNVISLLYPDNDPYRFNPWQGMTGDNAPGSTFKVVTAMAALKAANDNKTLNDFLVGSDIARYKAQTGLDPDATRYRIPNTPPAIKAIGTTHSIRQAAGALFDPNCGKKTNNRGVVGLPEATKDSLNNWYAHLGILMDAPSLNLNQPAQASHLVQMANHLGFNRVSSLDSFNLQRYKARTNARGDVLNAYAGSMDLARPSANRNEALQRLAQNSFGQGLTSTPLQMAKVAASIATGKNIQPQLLMALAGDDAEEPEHNDLELANLDSLRDGMKAVVQTGTAKGVFKGQLKCHVYGKTGTAEVGTKKSNFRISPWFMGWYAPPDKRPPLAFACMATHYPQRTGSYGGSICAPIINHILTAWNASADVQEAKK